MVLIESANAEDERDAKITEKKKMRENQNKINIIFPLFSTFSPSIEIAKSSTEGDS